MHRRALLATVGATGIAGCLGGDSVETADDTASTPGEKPAADAFEEIDPVTTTRTESVDTDRFEERSFEQPTELPLCFSVSFRSESKLPEVTIGMTNEGSRPYAVATSSNGLPFPGAVAENESGEALVAGVLGSNTPADEGLDCVTGTLTTRSAADRATLSPEDSTDRTVQVYNHADNGVCWPEGTFDFDATYEVWSAEQAFRFDFEFSLTV